MTESILISKLETIAKQDYRINQGENVIEIALEMIKHLGSVNPYLRDDLIYTTFYYWIIEKKLLSDQDLLMLIDKLIDDSHLFYKIGIEEDDSVLMRSFSLLVISLILARNINEHFINIELFNKVFTKIILYYNKERDLRGYDDTIGWIHSVAHGADAFGFIVLSDECNVDFIKQILAAIINVLNNRKYIFTHEEDERLTRVFTKIFSRKLITNEEIFNWLNDLITNVYNSTNRDRYIFRVNTKNLIRSLYFAFINTNDQVMIDKFKEMELKLKRF